MADDMRAPLVPADVDLRDFAFMPLDVARLRDSDLAANETPECCWAAVLLWAASWHQIPAGSMPNDDRWIAKQAGYAQRGKIADEWAEVRVGALHRWVECSDGRLYHPVVAEKAVEAWKAKMKQRYASEAARIKKHNQRHGTSLACPSFEQWTEQGCPQGHDLPVPRDKTERDRDRTETKPGQTQTVPRETPSKGQRQGQGQGQKKESSSSDSTPDDAERDLVRRIRIAMGSEPVIATADYPTGILRMLEAGREDESVVEADVFAGISAMFERCEHGFRLKRYSQAENWIRGAAKDRLAGKPRPGVARTSPSEPAGTTMIRGVSVPNDRIQARVDEWEVTGIWPDDVRDRWGPAPNEFGTCLPKRFLKPKVDA